MCIFKIIVAIFFLYVYDLIIRTIVIDLGNGKVKNFHRLTSSVVKAESQAKLVKEILELLTEEELVVYRHGRNAKSATSAKTHLL